jgi:hypothetical protein
MTYFTRRRFIGAAGLGGALGGSFLGSRLAIDAVAGQPSAEDLNWEYVELKPELVAAETYRLWGGNGCMYAIFKAVFEAWQKASGTKVVFPFHMMRYGHGGVDGWGTLCGALNGAAAAVGLFVLDRQQREKLNGELFSWYENAELPIYEPTDASMDLRLGDPVTNQLKGASKIVASKSQSVLCHISVSQWCAKAEQETYSNERRERCRRLTADVAIKAVEILNNHIKHPVHDSKHPVPTAKENAPKTIGKMKCSVCHGVDSP